MPRFEFREGTSSKFWEITLTGHSFTVVFGKIGTAGQTKTKSFFSADAAKNEYESLIAEKLKKGYQPSGQETSPVTMAGARGAQSIVTKLKLTKYRRSAWIPITKSLSDETGSSKYGGIPLLSTKAPWPKCQLCETPLTFFLQLHLSSLPVEPDNLKANGFKKGLPKGLLQFFFCTNEESECIASEETFGPYGDNAVVRIVAEGKHDPALLPKKIAKFAAKIIIDWKNVDDYPSLDELDEELDFEPDDLSDRDADALSKTNFASDKLLGWATWTQGVGYEDCSKCDGELKVLFQIDSERNIPFMFGDGGTGQIMACPKFCAPTFIWACN